VWADAEQVLNADLDWAEQSGSATQPTRWRAEAKVSSARDTGHKFFREVGAEKFPIIGAAGAAPEMISEANPA
jgi:hypothetical protein